jgi:hypothetical protein
MSHVLVLCIIMFFTRIGYTLLTSDMYKSSLRHIHDPALSSLEMEGIRLLYFCVLSIKCSSSSSSGGIRDTCSTRCENRISTITMHNSAERSQMRQQCNNARYTQFSLLRNARAYEWVWQKRVKSELRLRYATLNNERRLRHINVKKTFLGAHTLQPQKLRPIAQQSRSSAGE